MTTEVELFGMNERRQQAIDSIVLEAGCSFEKARSTLIMVEGIVAVARRYDYQAVLPAEDPLIDDEVLIAEALIPRDQTAFPHTAHAAIEWALLNESDEEQQLLNTKVKIKGKPPVYAFMVVLEAA